MNLRFRRWIAVLIWLAGPGTAAAQQPSVDSLNKAVVKVDSAARRSTSSVIKRLLAEARALINFRSTSLPPPPPPPPAPVLVRIAIAPKVASVIGGGSATFTVTGKRSDSSTVTPTVTYSATGGTVTAAGVYTAGSVAGSYVVRASAIGSAGAVF